MFRFSVIVPFYNRPQFVDAVLDSIQAQTFKSYEVICVDDGSTDNTLEILKNHPLIKKVISIQNSGPAIARNQAAKIAQGEYLAFLDSDDLWFEDALELADQWLRDSNEPSFLTTLPKVFETEKELNLSKRTLDSVNLIQFPNYLSSAGEFRWRGVSSFIIHRKSFQKVGGFVSKRMNAEDADLSLKLGMEPGFTHVSFPPLFAYRTHVGNITGNPEACYDGFLHIIDNFQNKSYPVDAKFKKNQIRLLSMHLRPIILALFREGHPKWARTLFWKSVKLHLGVGKVKFVAFGMACSFFRH